MTPAHKREARVSLAMLPVGGTVLVVSAFAFLLVTALGLDAAIRRPPLWGWTAAWSLFAVAVSLRNIRAGIAMMSAFDWRPLPAVAVQSGLVAVAWPGWWLG